MFCFVKSACKFVPEGAGLSQLFSKSLLQLCTSLSMGTVTLMNILITKKSWWFFYVLPVLTFKKFYVLPTECAFYVMHCCKNKQTLNFLCKLSHSVDRASSYACLIQTNKLHFSFLIYFNNLSSTFFSHTYRTASWYCQSFLYSPTDAQVNFLKINFKINIKIDVKTAHTMFFSLQTQ
jgi:hypothetical protein